MTLNASGPISLGGATVGQSINLELGQSATALSSINATNARTLAGIPSGQIALSNFYGKSSNSYWALVAAKTVLERGWAVSVNGVLCLGSGTASDTTYADTIYFFNVDGAFTKSTKCNSYYDTWGPSNKQCGLNLQVNNNSTTAPIFYNVVQNQFYDPYGFAPYDHTTNTNYFTSNYYRWGTPSGYWYGNAERNLVTDASGNIYLVPYNPTQYGGKFTASQTAYASWTSNGTFRYSYKTSGTLYAPPDFQGANWGVLRSDNVLVVAGTQSYAKFTIYCVNTSTGVQITNSARQYNRTSCTNTTSTFLCDSSNNLYLIFTNSSGYSTPMVYKIDSSYNASAAKIYAPDNSGQAQAGFRVGASMYNDVLYLMTTGETANAIVVVAVNTSTLDPIWTTKLTFSGTLSNTYAYYASTITATAVGIYLRVSLAGYNCIVKMPLDGVISGTKTITYPSGGGSSTVTFNYYTSGYYMCTASPTTFSYYALNSTPVVVHAGGGNTGTAPASGNTPTATTSTF